MVTLATTLLVDGPEGGDTLVVGPSLGTAVTPLWRKCADMLSDRWRVIGWDLPGHGHSIAADASFTVADLAESVRRAVRPAITGDAWYAGVSVGGAVGLHLALEDSDDWRGFAIICSSPRFMDEQRWRERAELVRRAGTPVMVGPSSKVWFAPGSIERDPSTSTALLDSLQHADAQSYAATCEALATFDVRDRLDGLPPKMLVIAGTHDEAAPPEVGQTVADASDGGRLEVIDDAAHLAPAEQPGRVAAILHDIDSWTR